MFNANLRAMARWGLVMIVEHYTPDEGGGGLTLNVELEGSCIIT